MFEFFFKYPRDDYARSELIFIAEWPGWLLPLLAIVAVAAITLILARRRAQTRPLQLLAVWALQIAVLAVVIMMLAQPALQTEQLRPGENSVAIVVDSSGSMAYGGTTSRFATALGSLSTLTSDSSLDITARLYSLSDSATHVETFDGLQPG